MTPEQPTVSPTRRVSKSTLLLLTFLLGGLGGHKFYLRRYAQAALYWVFLLFAFLPVLVALAEFIGYLFTSEDKLNARYGEVFSAPPSKKGIASALLILAFAAGVVFAIFIPIYNDRLDRNRIRAAFTQEGPWKSAITVFYEENRRFPSTLADLGSDKPPPSEADEYGTVKLGPNGTFTVTLTSKVIGFKGKTVIYTATPDVKDGSLKWTCTEGTLEMKTRLANCRL